jgi:hypothetical protein
MNARTDINMKPKNGGAMKTKTGGRKSVDEAPGRGFSLCAFFGSAWKS